MNSDNLVLKISKSRKNILEILEQYQNYEVSDYSNFSMHEIDTMYTNNQLDMLVKHKNSEKKLMLSIILLQNLLEPHILIT